MFLRRNRMPEAMSGMMAKFFASFIPIIALIWALDSFLVYRILYSDVFHIRILQKASPSLACLILVIIFLIIPVMTIINRCY